MTKVRITYFVLFALLLGSRLPSAAHAQSLSAIFQNLPTAEDGDDIWTQAAQAQSTAGPKYTSTAIEMKTFEGTFVPASGDVELWAFSDDGVNVQVKLDEIPGPGDTKQLTNKDDEQHLPTQAESLHKVPFTFQANKIYGVRVEYQNIVYNGESDIDGCTLFAIKDNATGVNLKINGTEDPVDDDWVCVSAAGGDRPSADLTIELYGAAGTSKEVFLAKAGDGNISFSDASPMVTVGTPVHVEVYGEAASSAKDTTRIEASFTSGGTVLTEEDLTVIDDVSLFFKGVFQDRLATDPDEYDDPRGTEGGARALEGEGDFDRIIRFSNPQDVRSHCSFTPVTVTKVIAGTPAGVEFTVGDSVIGQSVNLGPDSWFDGRVDSAGLEPIADFQFKIGTNMFFGEATTAPKGQGLAEMKAPELANRDIDPDAHFTAKRAALLADLMALPVADRTGTVQGRNLQTRIDLIDENFDPDNMFFTGFYPQNMTFKVEYPGVIDDNITINPGTSEIMKKFDTATSFDLEMLFLAWDYDCLMGRVEGTLKIEP